MNLRWLLPLAALWPLAAVAAHDGAAADWAEILVAEMAAGRPLPAISTYDAGLDLRAAYAVQRMLVDALPGGRPIGGYKAGFTSAEAQRKVGLREPIAGVLPESGRLASGAQVDLATFKRLMVEIEFGFVLRSPILRRMRSAADLATYVREVVPVVELPDLNYENPVGLNGRDLVATNIAARAYVVGKPLPVYDLAQLNAIEVKLYRDDALIDQGTGARALGDQREALLWLVNELVARGWSLLPGHVLITGTLGQINPGKPGRYRADYGGKGSLEFEVIAPKVVAKKKP